MAAWLKKIGYLLWFAGFTACSAPASPAATTSPMPTQPPTIEATPTQTAEPAWVAVPGAENLLADASWTCRDGSTVTADGQVTLQAGDNYLTVINNQGAYWQAEGAFGVRVTLEVEADGWGALTLFGKLPEGEWWQAQRRLDLGWDGSQVTVTYWDGTSSSPAFSQAFSAPDAQGQREIELGLRVYHQQLVVLVNGQETGRLDDPGVFRDGWAYSGANVPPGQTLRLQNLRLETFQGAENMVEVTFSSGAQQYQPSENPLRSLAQNRGLYIGAAVSPGPLRCEPDYAKALSHEFNLATVENALKFGPVHPQPDQYAFDAADATVEFALANDMAVRGHVLVWHQQNPAWLTNGSWTKDSLNAVLKDHIQTVVGRYKGKILYWDVINEAVEAAGLRDTLWLRTLGPEYLDNAFYWAHEADPEARLFYNDYETEGMNGKSDRVYELVKGMLERGVPVHGVGLQMHIPVSNVPYGLLENMQRLAALGLEVHITELDVRIDGQATPAKLQAQAETYREIMAACLQVEKCTAFITWGFTDAHSWVPGFFKGWSSALLFDEQYQPKPAYEALRKALQGE